MSKFGDLIHGKTTQTPVVETPVVEEPPVVDTAPASVEEPVDPEPLDLWSCVLYTSPSPRDLGKSRMPSSA